MADTRGQKADSMGRSKAMLYIFLCAIMWASGGLLIKLLDANPFTIACVRSIIVLATLLLIYPPRKLRFTKKVWLIAVPHTLNILLFVVSTKLTTAANAIVLQYLAPVFIILIGRMFLNERVLKEDAFVSAGCLFGMTLLFFDQLSPAGMLGNVLSVFGGITYALLAIFMSRTTEDRITLVIASHIEVAAVTLPFILLYPPEITALSVTAFLALGILQRGLSTVLYAKSTPHCSALDATLVSMVEPLLNPVLVMIFFGEKPGRFAVVGCAIVIVSVTLWNIYKIKRSVPDRASH